LQLDFEAGLSRHGTHMKHRTSIQTTPIPSNNEAAISARHAPVWKLRAYPTTLHRIHTVLCLYPPHPYADNNNSSFRYS